MQCRKRTALIPPILMRFVKMINFFFVYCRIHYQFLLILAQINFFVLPFSYIFIVYYFYQLERINWGLFLCFSSLSLYALAVFVFPSPGWFVWVVPFAAIYILASEGFSSKLYWLSSISCTLYFVVFDIITFTASREINKTIKVIFVLK